MESMKPEVNPCLPAATVILMVEKILTKLAHTRCCRSTDVVSTAPAPSGGRSFQVSGPDCAEEVAVRNRGVGPKEGGV